MKKVQPPSAEVMVQERTAGMKLVASLRPLVNNLIVKTPEDYQKADVMLSQVMAKRKAWKVRMAEVLDPLKEAVDAAKRAFKSADGLYDEIDGPIAELESCIKERMRAFKIEERRLIQAAEEARRMEEAKLEEELRLKTLAESKARTAAMSTKLMEQRARLQQSLADKKLEQTPQATKAAGSTTRLIKRCAVVDKLALIRHILASAESGEDLTELLLIDSGQLLAYFRLSDPPVGNWLPGVDVVEDINIAGRRQ